MSEERQFWDRVQEGGNKLDVQNERENISKKKYLNILRGMGFSSIRSRENMLVLAQSNDILGIIQKTRKIFLGPFLIFIFLERAV